MSRKQTTSEAVYALSARVASGKPAPTEQPRTLEQRKVRTAPSVFQHRKPHTGDSRAHVRSMAKALTTGTAKELDAVTVWWDGRGWTCIDGHHRLEAYRKSGAEPWQEIPVQVFTGGLEEAIAQAARGNTRAKLTMSTSERTRAAWRLTCTTSLSKAEVVEACGVGDGTVARMRRACKTLLDAGTASPCDLSWWEAQAKVKGQELPEREEMSDDDKQAKAEEWALAIRKSLPRGFENQVDILALTLETLSPRIPQRLQEEWWATEGEEELEE